LEEIGQPENPTSKDAIGRRTEKVHSTKGRPIGGQDSTKKSEWETHKTKFGQRGMSRRQKPFPRKGIRKRGAKDGYLSAPTFHGHESGGGEVKRKGGLTADAGLVGGKKTMRPLSKKKKKKEKKRHQNGITASKVQLGKNMENSV